MAGLDIMKKMKLLEQGQDHFHSMVKMHLSILLDLSTDDCDCTFLEGEKQEKEPKKKKAFSTPMKPKKPKGVMEGAPLTSEGACQVYQIIEFLGRESNISVEGLFRKHGNIKKQHALKERLNRGVSLNLDEGEFTVHECAAVLKGFLASLPQPLLTDAYYSAHCQVPLLVRDEMTKEERLRTRFKQVSALQLLFQLIPEVNYNLLKDLLVFLNRVSKYEKENKMNSSNLGTIFSTHILCPRKLSAETLQSNHQLLTKAVTFMIDEAESLFCLPQQLIVDIENFLSNRSAGCQTPLAKTRKLHLNCASVSGRRNDRADSPVVNTIFTFIDREATQVATAQSSTDQALAELYAHVQSMPESAHKKRLVSKLNEANGKGTPDNSLRARSRRKSGDGLMNLLTPRRKRPAHGSYSFQQSLEVVATPPTTSFRRQTSLKPGPVSATDQKLLSPSYSSPAVLSPNRDRLPSPCTSTPSSRDCNSTQSPHSQVSEPIDAIDEVDTPGKDSPAPESDESEEDLDGSYSVPPLPPRTPCPSLDCQSTGSITPTISTCTSTSPPSTPCLSTPPPPSTPCLMSPLTAASQRNPALKTPRSRQPVMVYSSQNLDQIPFALLDKNGSQKMLGCSEPTSPCVPTEYNEDEPDEALGDKNDKTAFFSPSREQNASVSTDSENLMTPLTVCDLNVRRYEGGRSKNAAYHDKSLSSDFKEYMNRHGLVLSADSTADSALEDSLVENDTSVVTENSKSFSDEVRRLLRDDQRLSTSLQVESSRL